MIGHENTYYKCQGRHEIKSSDKFIFVDLNDKDLLFEIRISQLISTSTLVFIKANSLK